MSPIDAQEARETLGADRIGRVGDRVVIEAARPNRDWVVSRYRPVAVDLPEGRYALRRAEPGEGGCWRYELTPWSRGDGDQPSLEVAYDADYVDARDRLHRATQIGGVARLVTAPLVPLLGFLPSPIKRALADRVGFEPRRATEVSLQIQRLALLALGALLVIHWSTRSHITAALDGWGWVLGLLLVDWVLRTGAMMDDRRAPPGLLEWLWPGSWGAR